MDAQIVIDCQTGKEQIGCEYCLVKEKCNLRLKLRDPIDFQLKTPNLFLSLVLLEAEYKEHQTITLR